MASHKTEIRVIYGDTDNMGQIYYANYFRWFEIARTEMFRSFGMSYSVMEKKGLLLPVSETFCKFISPIHYDDLIEIETSIDRGIKGGIKFNYQIYIKNEEGLLARGYTRHACIDTSGKVTRPPKYLQEMVKKIITLDA